MEYVVGQEEANAKPATLERIFLVSRLQNHGEAGAGYAGSDLLLVDREEIF